MILDGFYRRLGRREIPRRELSRNGFLFDRVTRVSLAQRPFRFYVYDYGYAEPIPDRITLFRLPALLPVVPAELERGDHDVFSADLTDQEPVLKDR